MEKIVEGLFLLQDTCSVYAVRSGGKTCFIDCGTNVATDKIQPETVLLTHFHRDQCAAAPRLQKAGSQIVVPFCERRFLEESDILRASYDIYTSYVSYYPCFTPLGDAL